VIRRLHLETLLLLVGFIVASIHFAEAQQKERIFRIGLLDMSTPGNSAVRLETFWEEIHKLGWIEGKNINIEQRFAEGKTDRLPQLAADLVRLKVDVIVGTSTATVLAAKSATTTIPIVMMSVADPLGAGLVSSLARPDGNVTGLSALVVELNTKRLEILKDAVPRLLRAGLLRSPGTNRAISADLQLKEIRAAAVALNLKLEEIKTEADAKSLESAFQTAKQKQVGAITTATGPHLFFAERKRIVELAHRHRLPAIYPQKEYVDDGGLMFYGVDSTDLYRRAAGYVDKILKGAKPGDLPVQQASKFEFVVNLKAAKQIGLTIPVNVLERASKVIK
jgi:putative tryptophan/tyrosine transport system substrate-binding protein